MQFLSGKEVHRDSQLSVTKTKDLTTVLRKTKRDTYRREERDTFQTDSNEAPAHPWHKYVADDVASSSRCFCLCIASKDAS